MDTLDGVEVGYDLELDVYELEPCVRHNTLTTQRHLEDAGAEVGEGTMQIGDWVIEMARVQQGIIAGALLTKNLRERHGAGEQSEALCDYTRWHLRHTSDVGPDRIGWANECTQRIWQQMAAILARVDIFICPTVANPEIAADFDYSRDQCLIDGKEVDANKGWFLTYPFNAIGRCPVMAMPTGFSPHGVPTGMQLVGAPYCDRALIALAAACEQVLPAWFDSNCRPASLKGSAQIAQARQ